MFFVFVNFFLLTIKHHLYLEEECYLTLLVTSYVYGSVTLAQNVRAIKLPAKQFYDPHINKMLALHFFSNVLFIYAG